MRDSPHGIFGSCTRYPRGLTRWAELLGRRRRRRRHLEIQVDIQARELYLEFVPMDLDSDETSRDIDTAVLHRISIPFIWAERFGPGSHFWKSVQISRNPLFFQNMHVHFSRNRFPKWVFPQAYPGSYLNKGELEGRSPSKMQGWSGEVAQPSPPGCYTHIT